MALYNNKTLEDQFVWRHMQLGKTRQFILDAAHKERDNLPLSDWQIKIAFRRYELFQEKRYFNLHHAKNFKKKVREILAQKLEMAAENIREDPAITCLRVRDTRIRGYNKICSNCGSRIDTMKTAEIKYMKVLMGKDDGEKGYFPAEREQLIFYQCENCGATQRR